MSPTDDGSEKSTDGGTGDIFDFEATEEISTSQRYREFFHEAFYLPAREAWRDWRMKVGLVLIFGYLFMGLVAWISGSNFGVLADVTIIESPRSNQFGGFEFNNEGPFQSWDYPLGTDSTGRDIFGAIVYATPDMLKMTFAGGVYVVVVATVVGTVAGYKGGRVDSVLTTISDIVMTVPGLPLVIVLATMIDPRNPWIIGPLLVIGWWAGLARTIRAQVLSIREESYVEASRTMGISTRRIIQKDIMPNLMPYIMVNFVMSSRQVIFNGVGLYFLGILAHGSYSDNWGVMMQFAYTHASALLIPERSYQLLMPMAAIVGLSFGLILFSQGTDRLFNPRVRQRGTGSTEQDGEEDEMTTTIT
ncbi:ABC transporter permease [Halobacteria archaeon AArc-m2/3/4]|uniref:ABC transporter permease n=1 Tax=Natronoglomus mannanivorans TaxID=2979990 RepID=A0AAP2YXH4_9EURY|nr:ABC transporter permease [Halobacteria archaeon AArc-xg1-1]MCU4972561.1 ABC transporter permease [Halobacteria archaeon AArc-m2/3/4]